MTMSDKVFFILFLLPCSLLIGKTKNIETSSTGKLIKVILLFMFETHLLI